MSGEIRVLHCVGHMKKAGAETFIMNMYREIDRSKVQFDFLCCEKETGEYDREIYNLGGRIFYTDSPKMFGKLTYLEKVLIFKKSFLRLKDNNIIHIHGHHAFDISIIVFAALLAGKNKIIVHSHNSSAEAHIRLHKLFKYILSKINITKLACSSLAGEWMFIDDKYTVIPNGINISSYIFDNNIRNKYREEYDLKDKFVIGHIGRFEEQKNHMFLIELFLAYHRIDPQAMLVLVGDGEDRTKILNYINNKNLNENIMYLGVRDDVSKLYSMMDAFCFPSIYEGLGIVAVEAQATDLPCVFSDVLPVDINISDRIFRCSLNDSMDVWVEALKKCKDISVNSNRRNNYELIKKHNFDVNSSCNMLYNIYLGMI